MKNNVECEFVKHVSENELPIVYFRVIWALSLPFLYFICISVIYVVLLLLKQAKWKK